MAHINSSICLTFGKCRVRALYEVLPILTEVLLDFPQSTQCIEISHDYFLSSPFLLTLIKRFALHTKYNGDKLPENQPIMSESLIVPHSICTIALPHIWMNRLRLNFVLKVVTDNRQMLFCNK